MKVIESGTAYDLFSIPPLVEFRDVPYLDAVSILDEERPQIQHAITIMHKRSAEKVRCSYFWIKDRWRMN